MSQDVTSAASAGSGHVLHVGAGGRRLSVGRQCRKSPVCLPVSLPTDLTLLCGVVTAVRVPLMPPLLVPGVDSGRLYITL